MGKVQHYKCMGILLGTCKPDAIPAPARGDTGRIGGNSNDTIVHTRQIISLSGCAVDIVDVAGGRIIFCVEGKQRKEVVAAIIILDRISSEGEWSQSAAKKKGGNMHSDCKE